MKIEIDGIHAPEEYELLAEFFTKSAALVRARYEEDRALLANRQGAMLAGSGYGGLASNPNGQNAATTNAVEETAPAPAEEPEAPAKRKRRTKAEIEADKAAEEAAAAPEVPEEGVDVAFPEEEKDDQPDFFNDDEAPAEEDDLIEGYAVTFEGLQASMRAYVDKFDMAAAQKNAKTLFGGYAKSSEVAAAGEAAIATAIRNFANAVNTGKEV